MHKGAVGGRQHPARKQRCGAECRSGDQWREIGLSSLGTVYISRLACSFNNTSQHRQSETHIVLDWRDSLSSYSSPHHRFPVISDHSQDLIYSENPNTTILTAIPETRHNHGFTKQCRRLRCCDHWCRYLRNQRCLQTARAKP